MKLSLCIILIIISQLLMANDNSNLISTNAAVKYLNIPERNDTAIGGKDFANKITGLSLEDRETVVADEILLGNVPSFSRKLRAITRLQVIGNEQYELTYYALCDYVAIGSDADYMYVPMTPSTAQFLADRFNCSLPTKQIVDEIYNKAGLKLKPQPIPPTSQMTTVPVFLAHSDSIKRIISYTFYDRLSDSIVAGHKKDIIISNKIYSSDRNYDRVVIYGWHRGINNPIQPVYNGHNAMYADYSHGVRLISNVVHVNDDSLSITEILSDTELSVLLSSEGVISKPYYPPSDFLTSLNEETDNHPSGFILFQNYPNPFNPSTTIEYSIPQSEVNIQKAGQVSLSIYNSLGCELFKYVDIKMESNNYKVKWNANGHSSGVYYYRLISNNFTQTRKMLFLK